MSEVINFNADTNNRRSIDKMDFFLGKYGKVISLDGQIAIRMRTAMLRSWEYREHLRRIYRNLYK